MAKAKKMADGGLADYLKMSPAKSGGGGGAFGGLEAVNQGAGQIGQSLNEIGSSTDAVKAALGNSGGGSAPSVPTYEDGFVMPPQRPASGDSFNPLTQMKKGGSVKKQLKSGRISTAQKNSKSPNW